MTTKYSGRAAMVTAVFLSLFLGGEPAAAGANEPQLADVVREWNEDGSAASGGEVIGWSRLVRRENELRATVRVEGLVPGGLYTFWWIVPHTVPPNIPFDVFAARGASAIADRNGRIRVRMSAHKGQQGIAGFPAIGGFSFHELTEPLTALVRVEVAYHGRATDAGQELASWLTDFWTGDACPVDPATEQGAVQPHCPVNFAATHVASP